MEASVYKYKYGMVWYAINASNTFLHAYACVLVKLFQQCIWNQKSQPTKHTKHSLKNCYNTAMCVCVCVRAVVHTLHLTRPFYNDCSIVQKCNF